MNVVTRFPALREYDGHPSYRAMFEAAAIGIGICDLNGRILEANPALSRMLGYSQQELTSAHAKELYPGLGRAANLGGFVPDFLPGLLPDDQPLADLLRGERESFEIEKRYRRKDGSEFWGCLTISLARDARGQPGFLIVMLADASARRQVEEHLREAGKMEVIGRLAGGIAHDFNNLLTGILLYCDLLSAGLDGGSSAEVKSPDRDLAGVNLEDDDLRDDDLRDDDLRDTDPPDIGLPNRASARSNLSQHVDEVRMAGEQGSALTRQLLAIACKQAAEPQPVLINEIVASTENLLRRLIGEQIELVTVLDSSTAPVLADPAQLRQVVMNLVLNARDAMPQGGKISLVTRPVEFSSRTAVSLTVKDNGCGMNAETRARLFEPFFTTKNPGRGTGIGLATVQRIVTEAGGKIVVESEEGRGTSIEVFFPAIAPPNLEIGFGHGNSSEIFGAPAEASEKH